MAKSSKKTTVRKNTKAKLQPETTKVKPARVGGRNGDGRQLDWPKVGRRRVETAHSVQTIASALKSVRESKGVSLTSLAKELEVAPATLIKFEEKGHPVSIGVVNAMAKKLGCTLEIKTSKAVK